MLRTSDATATLGKIPDDRRILRDRFLSLPATRRCLALLGDYRPKDTGLFLQAFTHASFIHEHPKLNLAHYQRLEFLGDSAISLYVADKLYRLFPDMNEGELSLLRSSLVCQESLAALGRFLKLDELLLLGKGTPCSASLICDTFEALVGSIHWDRGSQASHKALDHLFDTYRDQTGITLIHRRRGEDFDKKSQLQEIALRLHGETPQYRHQKLPNAAFKWSCGLRAIFWVKPVNPPKKRRKKIWRQKP